MNKRLFSAYIQGDGIEVGGLHNPMPVGAGARVRYVDRFDDDELDSTFEEIQDKPKVSVDIVAAAEKLSTALAHGSVDFVLANHVIEHIEDPIGALVEFYKILKPGGIVHLAVPDKRATFDRARQRTTLDHLISDHEVRTDEEREERSREHYIEWTELVPQSAPAPTSFS